MLCAESHGDGDIRVLASDARAVYDGCADSWCVGEGARAAAGAVWQGTDGVWTVYEGGGLSGEYGGSAETAGTDARRRRRWDGERTHEEVYDYVVILQFVA